MEKPALHVLINGQLYDSIYAVPEDVKATLTPEQISTFTQYEAPEPPTLEDIMQNKKGMDFKLNLNEKTYSDFSAMPEEVRSRLTPEVISQLNQKEWNAGIQFINPQTGQAKNLPISATLLLDAHDLFLNILAQFFAFAENGLLYTIAASIDIRPAFIMNFIFSICIGQISFFIAKKWNAASNASAVLMPEQLRKSVSRFQLVMKSGQISFFLMLVYYVLIYIFQSR